MTPIPTRAAATACASLVALTMACSRAPGPVASAAPVGAPSDSAAPAARRDSLARASGQRDSLTQVVAARTQAEQVAAEVNDEVGMAPEVTATGLSARDSAVIAGMVHFDFNRADIRAEDQAVLDAKLLVLRANPLLEVQIAGHCDDRGPDEYNLALGNRRAGAVLRWFTDRGIAPARLTIISYGEERPADARATEEAWATNRRAEFLITRPAR